MNFKYYHTPLKPTSTRVRCPVCHEIVYSTAGIHPQCAVKRPTRPGPRSSPSRAPAPRRARSR